MHICIISEFYPTEEKPLFPFVQQLAHGLTDLGVSCSIIAPQSITKVLMGRGVKYPEYVEEKYGNGLIRVYRPCFITFSNTTNRVLQSISAKLFDKAVRNTFKKIDKVDCVYSYFWHVGYNVAEALYDIDVPIVVQASECWISINDYLKRDKLNQRIDAVVCASKKNYDESVEANLIKDKPYSIIPNGYNPSEFYYRSKKDARKELNIDPNIFIIAFVGGFQERKGIHKLSEALNRFEDVYSIFIGQGDTKPYCKNILFQGAVPHTHIRKYLNAADCFVLPTSAEGCCNAIIEALACGLPVISSNKSFNDEILNEYCSIRVDENNVDEIYEAIKEVKINACRRKEMSEAATEKASSLTLGNRAKNILAFLKSNVIK